MSLISFAIISCPREEETYTKAARALVKAGAPFITFYDEQKEGAFVNFVKALELLMQEEKEFVCVLHDDHVMHPDAIAYLEECLELDKEINKRPVYALCTIEQDIPHEERKMRGWLIHRAKDKGWSGAFVMPKSVAQEIMNCKTFQEHADTIGTGGQIDACIFRCCDELNVDVYVHNPSICDHIGDTSTLGHDSKGIRGFNFNPKKPLT